MASQQHDVEFLRDLMCDPTLLEKVYPACHNDDQEVLKASLLLQSALLLFKGMRAKNVQLTASVELSSSERKEIIIVAKKLEDEVRRLKNECSSLNQKLQDAIAHGESVSAKLNSLEQQLAQKVDERAHTIFLSCLKKNRGATVLDWMTQMNQETQDINRGLLDDEDSVALKEYIVMSTDSPDEIGGTPESAPKINKVKKMLQYLRSPKTHESKEVDRIPHSLKSASSEIRKRELHKLLDSPDIINSTPDALCERKHIMLRKGFNELDNLSKRKLLEKSDQVEGQSGGKRSSVIVYDTQDDESEFIGTPVLRTNIIIPETLQVDNIGNFDGVIGSKLNVIPETPKVVSPVLSCDGGKEARHGVSITAAKLLNSSCCGLNAERGYETDQQDLEKENTMISSSKKRTSKTLADISTDVEFPVTPEKQIRPVVDGSPILGSGGQKSQQKISGKSALMGSSSQSLLNNHTSVSNCSTTASKDSKVQLLLSIDKTNCDVQHERRSRGLKRVRQSKLSGKLRLSSSKRPKDVSTFHEFNGGRRAAPLESIDISQLSERDQYQIAVSRSLQDSPNTRRVDMEDSDVTFFEPQELLKKSTVTTAQATFIPEMERDDRKSSALSAKAVSTHETVFEPLFASTAKQEISQSDSPDTVGIAERTPTPLTFNVPSTAETPFNPLCASTEKDETQNSELERLVRFLDAEELNSPPETSFDRLPRKHTPSPNYKHIHGAVRKKVERQNLDGFDCPDCRRFNRAAGYEENDPKTKHLLKRCSRHRAKHGIRVPSPEGFWDPGFPPTQVLRDRQKRKPKS